MKAKSIIIIIATLMLGFILGMLTFAQIRHRKLKPISFFLSEDRFRGGLYSVINPDEKQKEILDKIVREYAKRNQEIQTEFWKDLDDFMGDLWKELEPVLTPEQVEKLVEMQKKRPPYYSRGKGNPDDSMRGGPDFGNRMRYPGDSARMRMYGDSARMNMYGDSARMKMHGDSTRMRGPGHPPGGPPERF